MIFGVFYTLMTHNHKFATSEEKCNLRSRSKVLPAHGNIISTMVSLGIKHQNLTHFYQKNLVVQIM